MPLPKGLSPLQDGPLFLGLTFIDFFIFGLYLNCGPRGSCYFPLEPVSSRFQRLGNCPERTL